MKPLHPSDRRLQPLHNWPVALGLLLVLHAGCAHTVGEMAGAAATSATPAVINESLKTLDTDATRKLILDLLSNPDVQKSAQMLIARLTDGALDALSRPERAERIAQLAEMFLTRIFAAVEHTLHTAIGPEVANMVSETVDAALQHAMSPENQERMADTVAKVTERAVTVLATTVNAQMHTTLRTVLREDLGPALRDGLNDKATQDALGATMRTMTKQAMLGMQDAFVEIDKRDHQGAVPPTLFSRMQRLAVEGSNLARYVAIALGALVLLLGFWLFRTRSRVSLVTREADRREAALLSLAQAIKSTEDKAWSPELRDAIENALRDDEKAEYLRELWRTNKAARLSPGVVVPPPPPTH
jgi:hypothetical protein